MRRNSTHKKYLRISFWILLTIYIMITDIFYFLPPLFGIIYVLTQEHYENKDYSIFYILAPFLIFFESTKGLPLFSTLLFMIVSFEIILPKFRKFFGYHNIFILLFVAYAYFGYFIFLNFFGFLYDVPKFSWLIGFYIICEMILVWFFLRILE